MQPATPSQTAFRVAIRRAEHQILDHPRVFEDALSLRILGPDGAARIRPGRVSRQQRLSPSFRAFTAVRSRYAEDEVARSVAAGVAQYVILGAGLDTFAYRNPWPLRVFEVDYPATQAWKRGQLAAAGLPIPDNLTFVETDFERHSVAETLADAGFRRDRPAFFSWLGVVPYLSEGAFDETLSFLASLPPRSGVVLDYAVPRGSLNEREQMALDALSARVAYAGEPFQLFFTPEELARKLQDLGFREWEDLGRDAMNARYFSGRSDQFRVKGNLAHLLTARVSAV